jgi:hypothetical protein
MDNQIPKYNRIRGALEGIALFTKAATIKNVQSVTGLVETFTVETGRHPEVGDYVFVEMVDENTEVTRLALPPKVVNAIVRQREALTGRTRSRAAKDQAKARKERGEVPGFMRKAG